jgi:transitional endoplasmic reticulum ATPase
MDVELRITEALAEDVGKGLARLDPEDMKALSAVLGDLVEISGEKKTVARITGTFQESYGKKVLQIDGITRANAKVNLGEKVRLRKIPRQTATTVLVSPLDFSNVLPEERELDQYAKLLQGLPVTVGDKINIPFLAGKERLFQVEATAPTGGVIINQKTQFSSKSPIFL